MLGILSSRSYSSCSIVVGSDGGVVVGGCVVDDENEVLVIMVVVDNEKREGIQDKVSKKVVMSLRSMFVTSLSLVWV